MISIDLRDTREKKLHRRGLVDEFGSFLTLFPTFKVTLVNLHGRFGNLSDFEET